MPGCSLINLSQAIGFDSSLIGCGLMDLPQLQSGVSLESRSLINIC